MKTSWESSTSCRQQLAPQLWGFIGVMNPPLPCYEAHPGVHWCKQGHAVPVGTTASLAGLRAASFCALRKHHPFPGCVNAFAGPLHQHLQAHWRRRFPSHFPKLRQRQMRQFSISLYPSSLLTGHVPQAGPGELTALFQFCLCPIELTTLLLVPAIRSQCQ